MSKQAKSIAASIEAWFVDHARDLPWRKRRTRWRSFVSEIMLQQTQVARVEERFEAFMNKFPTPRALAEASEDAVNAAWSGLGYYRRARNLQAAAVKIHKDHGGRVPVRAGALLDLPGVGRYTAGAVASIACGQAEPIVDGNVHRVLARLDADNAPLDDKEASVRTWKRARELVEASDSPGVFNEGLMELGSQVCTRHSPACSDCPVRRWCKARKQDLVDVIPPARKRVEKTIEHHHAIGIVRQGKFVMQRRPSKGRWAGLWQMPTVEAARRLGDTEIKRRLGMPVQGLTHVSSFERVLTHRRIRFHVYRAKLAKGQRVPRGDRWIPSGQSMTELPLGVAQELTLKALKLI
ncbi:MAG: A/G-specific adenine glycosylase [Phycisphaerales bacterium]|nr:A/G-specific adenine glycosylase [Phycisphaerales bacterium]